MLSREVAAREASERCHPHPFGRVPDPQIVGGLQLRSPASIEPGHGRASGHQRVLGQSPQRGAARPTRHRQTHIAIGLAIKAAQAGHRIAFATAVDWVARLKAAHNAGRLPAELAKLRRIGLLVVDEVGYIPFDKTPPTCSFNWSPAATNTPR